jgi:hypothetical protein
LSLLQISFVPRCQVTVKWACCQPRECCNLLLAYLI